MFNNCALKCCFSDWLYFSFFRIIGKVDSIRSMSRPYFYFFFLAFWCVLGANVGFMNKIVSYSWLLLIYVVPASSYWFFTNLGKIYYLMAHMVPDSVPLALGGGIALVETISLAIRPFVVYLRICVNVVGGGLLLGIRFDRLNYWGCVEDGSRFLSFLKISWRAVFLSAGLITFCLYELWVACLH